MLSEVIKTFNIFLASSVQPSEEPGPSLKYWIIEFRRTSSSHNSLSGVLGRLYTMDSRALSKMKGILKRAENCKLNFY